MPRYVILISKAGSNYSAHIPDVDGVVATGATVGEVTDMLREALELHLEGSQLAGEPLPQLSVIASAVDVEYSTDVAAAAQPQP